MVIFQRQSGNSTTNTSINFIYLCRLKSKRDISNSLLLFYRSPSMTLNFRIVDMSCFDINPDTCINACICGAPSTSGKHRWKILPHSQSLCLFFFPLLLLYIDLLSVPFLYTYIHKRHTYQFSINIYRYLYKMNIYINNIHIIIHNSKAICVCNFL